MAYFYVNTGGTRTTGGGLTKQTGTFPSGSNAYATRADALTDGAGAGDYICYADTFTWVDPASSATTLTSPVASTATGVALVEISVDATACDNYKAGASLSTNMSNVYDMLFSSSDKFVFYGMTFISDDNFTVSSSASVYGYECTFIADDPNADFQIAADNALLYLDNSIIQMDGNAASSIVMTSNAMLVMNGGEIRASTSGFSTLFDNGSAINGGMQAYLTGVDISDLDATLSGTTTYIAKAFGSNIAEDGIKIELKNCTIGGITGYAGELFYQRSQSILLTNTSDASVGNEYQYALVTAFGTVEDDTSVTRAETLQFPDAAQDVSLKVVTEARCTKEDPFIFEVPARYADLGDATKDHIDIFLATNTAATDTEIWAKAIYPDGTTKNSAVVATTRGAEIFDDAGTALTDDSGSSTWEGTAMTYEYKISIDTTKGATVTGLECAPIILIYVGKASWTGYFDTTVELSA